MPTFPDPPYPPHTKQPHWRIILRDLILVIHAFILVGCTAASQPASPRAANYQASSADLSAACHLNVAGGRIDVIFQGSSRTLSTESLCNWVRTSAQAISGYFDRFPLSQVRITLILGGSDRIGGGSTDDNGIQVQVGRRANQSDLDADWIMTHEMFHLAFPDMDDQFIWLREGLASYLEPLARSRLGTLSPAEVWGQLYLGLPKGQPAPGDRGLDRTHTWGRTYWGGSMFCLLMDLRIREQTHNLKSIDDAMRAILDQGGNRKAHWPIQHVIDVADRATGTTVMRNLYHEMALEPRTIDLNAIWKELGVVYHDDQITFDAAAPLAALRMSMTANPATDIR